MNSRSTVIIEEDRSALKREYAKKSELKIN
jgi:hypothetical protein